MSLERLVQSQLDRIVAGILAGGSIVALLAGWLGVSRNAYVANQVSYMMSGAVTAILLLGIGATIWISADLRDEWRKLDSIDEALRSLAGTDLVAELPEELAPAKSPDELVQTPAGAEAGSLGVEARRRRSPLQAQNVGA